MFRSTLSLIWDIVHQQSTANSFRHWDTNSSHVAMAAHESNCLPVWHANITSDSSVMVSSMSAWREWASHPCPEALSRQSKKYRRSKLNGLESSHRHWFGRRSKAFRGVRLVPLVMAGVEPWKEGEFYQCEAWGREREREWSKCVCGPDLLALVHTNTIAEFIYDPFGQNLWSRGT